MKCTSKTSRGEILHWNEYEYDSDGKLQQVLSYNPDAGHYYTSKMNYNTKGQITEVESYKYDDLDIVNYFKYDSDGNLILNTDSHNYGTFKYKYDKKGRLTKFMTEESPNFVYEIEYDDDGYVSRVVCNTTFYDGTIGKSYEKYYYEDVPSEN